MLSEPPPQHHFGGDEEVDYDENDDHMEDEEEDEDEDNLLKPNVNFLHGNELGLFEKRKQPLTFMPPYFSPNTMNITQNRIDMVPMRMTDDMRDARSEEMLSHGMRRLKDIRKMKNEFTEKIKEVIARQKREEMEKEKKPKDRMRWWKRKTDIAQRDPLKLQRFNNLTIAPEDLMNTKDIVILNLTGAKLCDESMTWVGAFIQQSYTLKRINLQGNFITEEGCSELYTGVRNSKTLMDLDLSLNPIGDDGVSVICNALVENTRNGKVYKLNVSTCNLSSQAGLSLARLVRESKALTCLLAWRNRLGVGLGAKHSGAAMILEELRNSKMKLVDLTANNITDRDASDHAQMYEIEARKLRLMEIQKTQSIARLEQLREEIKKSRREAVWDDQKVAVGRLEKEAEQLKAKIRMNRELENRKRSYDEKRELEFKLRVKNHTGVELLDVKVKTRLILTGNHSIMPQTLKRLHAFYDMDREPNYRAFVDRPRRFDNILVPRRTTEDSYELRDPDSYDEHNCLPWDKFNPSEEHERRQALLAWREEERRKLEEMQPIKFEKFKLNAAEAPKGKNVKAVSGIGVASGVNARVRMTRNEHELKPREMPKPKVRQEAPSRAAGTKTTTETTEVEAPEIVKLKKDKDGNLVDPDGNIVDPSGKIIDHKKKDDDTPPAATATPAAPTATTKSTTTTTTTTTTTKTTEEATPAAQKVKKHADSDESSSDDESQGPPPDGFWRGSRKSEQYEQLIPGSARRGDSDEEVTEDDSDDEVSEDDGVEAYDDEEWEEKELDEQQWMQEKLRQRTEELRLHVNARAHVVRATPREQLGGSVMEGSERPAGSLPDTPRVYGSEGIVAVKPAVPAITTSFKASASDNDFGSIPHSARSEKSLGDIAPDAVPAVAAHDLVPSSAKVEQTTVVIPALALSQEEPKESKDFRIISDAMLDIATRREEITRLGEIGSPSDEDIRKRETEVKALGEVKSTLADQILHFAAPCSVPEVHVEPLSTFVESLVGESDLTPGNTDLFQAFMANVQLNFPALISERGLAATAAIDGSMSYLELILAVPGIIGPDDMMEVIYACVFNQACRIPLAKLLLDMNVDFATIINEVMPVMQEFFEDIASEKRAIPKEDRRARVEVLEKIIAHPVLGPNLILEEEGADAQTCFSRALYEGDLALVKMLLGTGKIGNINMVKSDNTTPLMQAVFGNSPDVVQTLFEAFPGGAIEVNHPHPENGNAVDIALGLGRDAKIVEILKANGGKGSGTAKAPAKVPGKKTIKVKVAVGKGTKGAPKKPAAKKAGASSTGAKKPAAKKSKK